MGFFDGFPTATLEAVLCGWEREYDRAAAGDSGSLPLDYLTNKMHDIRQIIQNREDSKREQDYMNRGRQKRPRKP